MMMSVIARGSWVEISLRAGPTVAGSSAVVPSWSMSVPNWLLVPSPPASVVWQSKQPSGGAAPISMVFEPVSIRS
jgi:hypothetical protein